MGDVYVLESVQDPGGLDFTGTGEESYEEMEAIAEAARQARLLPSLQWDASLAVPTGDVLRPFARLLDQAMAAGQPLHYESGSSLCRGAVQADGDLTDIDVFPTATSLTRIECAAEYSVTTTGRDSTVLSSTALSVRAVAGPGPDGRLTQSYVTIHYQKLGDGGGGASIDPTADGTDIRLDLPPVSLLPTTLPRPGESLGFSVRGAPSPGVVVPIGALAVSAPLLTGCAFYGWYQVLTPEAAADALVTFDDLVEQVQSAGYRTSSGDERDAAPVMSSVDGVTTVDYRAYLASSGGMTVRLTTDTSPTILVTYCPEF